MGLDGWLSALCPVTSGVPQGKMLGPLLFLVHIAIMGAHLATGNTITSFVDDTTLKRGIIEEQDCATLQLDLKAFYSWTDMVNIHFNKAKFVVFWFWADRSAPSSTWACVAAPSRRRTSPGTWRSRLVLTLCSVPRWTVQWQPGPARRAKSSAHSGTAAPGS